MDQAVLLSKNIEVCFEAKRKAGAVVALPPLQPGLHEPQLQVEWSVTLLCFILVE